MEEFIPSGFVFSALSFFRMALSPGVWFLVIYSIRILRFDLFVNIFVRGSDLRLGVSLSRLRIRCQEKTSAYG